MGLRVLGFQVLGVGCLVFRCLGVQVFRCSRVHDIGHIGLLRPMFRRLNFGASGEGLCFFFFEINNKL